MICTLNIEKMPKQKSDLFPGYTAKEIKDKLRSLGEKAQLSKMTKAEASLKLKRVLKKKKIEQEKSEEKKTPKEIKKKKKTESKESSEEEVVSLA